MQKIIVAFDGLNYSKNARDYAVRMAKENGAHLTGIFLDDMTYTSYKIYDLILKDGVSEKKLKSYREKDNRERHESAEDFESLCRKEGIPFNVHHDKNVAIQALIHESVFADLLIIDSKETLTHYEEKLPSRFMRDLLANVHCPVFLVAQHYTPVKNIIFLYDGLPTSVYAIKSFKNTFPGYFNASVELLSVKAVDDNLHLPDNTLMKEFMKLHFKNPVYTVLRGLAETELIRHLSGRSENTVLALGAYGRSYLSRWYRSSLADVLFKENRFPFYIAHH